MSTVQDDFVDTPVRQALTKTEKKVLKLILEGKGNKGIAYRFQSTLRTIERHRNQIMHKFDVGNIVDLAKKLPLQAWIMLNKEK